MKKILKYYIVITLVVFIFHLYENKYFYLTMTSSSSTSSMSLRRHCQHCVVSTIFLVSIITTTSSPLQLYYIIFSFANPVVQTGEIMMQLYKLMLDIHNNIY